MHAKTWPGLVRSIGILRSITPPPRLLRWSCARRCRARPIGRLREAAIPPRQSPRPPAPLQAREPQHHVAGAPCERGGRRDLAALGRDQRPPAAMVRGDDVQQEVLQVFGQAKEIRVVLDSAERAEFVPIAVEQLQVHRPLRLGIWPAYARGVERALPAPGPLAFVVESRREREHVGIGRRHAQSFRKSARAPLSAHS